MRGFVCEMNCIDDAKLKELLIEAIAKLSYTTGVMCGISSRLRNNEEDHAAVVKVAQTNMAFWTMAKFTLEK